MRPEPVHSVKYDLLPVEIFQSNQDMGLAAALDARDLINQAIASRGSASIVLATGSSQLTFLHALRDMGGIDWGKVVGFHLDQYIGIDPNHRASFPLFLQHHLLDQVKPGTFYPLTGKEGALEQACQEYKDLLQSNPVDLLILGIGENGHIAFNDPPARFDDPVWLKVVKLDEIALQQQVNEKNFDSLDEVPRYAITLTVPAILAAKKILCLVPEFRKADIVRACLKEPVDELRPGSVLRRVSHAKLYLDQDSASKL